MKSIKQSSILSHKYVTSRNVFFNYSLNIILCSFFSLEMCLHNQWIDKTNCLYTNLITHYGICKQSINQNQDRKKRTSIIKDKFDILVHLIIRTFVDHATGNQCHKWLCVTNISYHNFIYSPMIVIRPLIKRYSIKKEFALPNIYSKERIDFEMNFQKFISVEHHIRHELIW